MKHRKRGSSSSITHEATKEGEQQYGAAADTCEREQRVQQLLYSCILGSQGACNRELVHRILSIGSPQSIDKRTASTQSKYSSSAQLAYMYASPTATTTAAAAICSTD